MIHCIMFVVERKECSILMWVFDGLDDGVFDLIIDDGLIAFDHAIIQVFFWRRFFIVDLVRLKPLPFFTDLFPDMIECFILRVKKVHTEIFVGD